MQTKNFISSTLIFAISILSTLFIVRCMPKMSESIEDHAIGLNGGFEHIKNTLPINWLVYSNKIINNSDFKIMYDTSDFKEGKQSLKFEVKNCSNKGGRFSPGIAQEIKVVPMNEYVISFWVKNNESNFLINISSVNATEKFDGPKLASSESTEGWQKHEYRYTIPKEMNHLRIEVSILEPGTFWIDDVKIEKLNNS